MKNYTDVPYERLAIIYLVQDSIDGKKTLMLIGITIINTGLVITQLLLKGIQYESHFVDSIINFYQRMTC